MLGEDNDARRSDCELLETATRDLGNGSHRLSSLSKIVLWTDCSLFEPPLTSNPQAVS